MILKAIIDCDNKIMTVDDQDLIFNDHVKNDVIERIITNKLPLLDLNEYHSCEVTIKRRVVIISGDEDYREYRISLIEPIV